MMVDRDGEDLWPRLRFELMWTEHGGGGLGMSFEAVNGLDFQDIVELLELMREQKKREADAIRSARSSR